MDNPLTDISAFLFDLGNVVFYVNMPKITADFSQAFSVPRQKITDFISHNMVLFEKFEKAKISENDFFSFILTHFNLPATSQPLLRQIWNDIYGEAVTSTIDFLKALKASQKYQIYALTNTNRSHSEIWTQKYENELKYFDAIYTSDTLRLRKPEKEVFEFILKKHNLSPQEVIFIDDLPENTAAAAGLGFKTITFTPATDLRDLIKYL